MTRSAESAGRPWQGRLDALRRRYGVVGAQFGIVRLDAVGRQVEHVAVASGLADVDRATSVTNETLFEIGSITKMWTGILILQLVAEGTLSLDTPVRDVIPQFTLRDPDAAASVTIRMLLSHTSGIEGDLFTDTGEGDDSVERYVASLRSARALHPAGARFSYCNAGFVIAGRIVEVMRGARWSDVVAERIVAPLGLTHTTADRDAAARLPLAAGHTSSASRDQQVARGRIPRALAPAGLIASNARDMLAFAGMLLRDGGPRHGVLAAASAAAMRQVQVDLDEVPVASAAWGLGAMLENWDATSAWGHDGATIGQKAYLRLLPDRRTAAVLLTSGGRPDGLFRELFEQVATRYADASLPPTLSAMGRLGAVPQRSYGFEDAGAELSADGEGALLTVIEPSETGGEPRRSTFELYESSVPGVWAWTTPDLAGWAPLRPVDGGAYLGLRFLPARELIR